MPKSITLRKAAKIRNRLDEVINEARRDALNVTLNVEVTDADVATTVATAHQHTLDSIDVFRTLGEARETLRGLIGNANHSNGISDLMTQAAQKRELLGLYEQLLRYNSEPYWRPTDANLASRIASRQKLLENNESFNNTTLPIFLLSETDYSNLDNSRNTLKSDIEDLTDKIEALNASIMVQLTDDLVTALTAVGIRV